MVERNSVMVRCEATRQCRKQRDVTYTIDPEDQSAFCDVNVARGEPVVRRPGRQWDHSHVFFAAGTKPRHCREQSGIRVAVDLIDFLGAVFAHQEKIRRSGHARGKGDLIAKGNWIGGVKNACER